MNTGPPNFGPWSGDVGEREMDSQDKSGPWYRGMTGYHWWVLIVASLGWSSTPWTSASLCWPGGRRWRSCLPAGPRPAK